MERASVQAETGSQQGQVSACKNYSLVPRTYQQTVNQAVELMNHFITQKFALKPDNKISGMNSPLAQLQRIKRPEVFAYNRPIKCHIKPRKGFKKLINNENNLLAMSNEQELA